MPDVLVVTGGSRGIGAATCLRAAADGWSVVVGYLRTPMQRSRSSVDCRSAGVAALGVQGDVASERDVVALFDAAAKLGRVGGLVNNAGIVAAQGAFADDHRRATPPHAGRQRDRHDAVRPGGRAPDGHSRGGARRIDRQRVVARGGDRVAGGVRRLRRIQGRASTA